MERGSSLLVLISLNVRPSPFQHDDEREALKTLSKDKTITIFPVDKGRMMVVMDTEEYKRKAKELLSDTNTYKVLKKDPTAVYLKQLNKTIEDLYMNKTITVDLKQKLKPTSTLTPRFYGLPKVHKRDNPLRPIVASRAWSPTSWCAMSLMYSNHWWAWMATP